MTDRMKAARSKARSAARLAATQALYQHDMEATPVAQLLHEFHQHRLGTTIDDEDFDAAEYADAEVDFFDDLVRGTIARLADVDAALTAKLSANWSFARLDRSMKAVLRVGAYELIARPDVPSSVAISEYVDVAKAFHDVREAGFVNGILDAVAKEAGR
jgi:transcription antitermination protein NusB